MHFIGQRKYQTSRALLFVAPAVPPKNNMAEKMIKGPGNAVRGPPITVANLNKFT